jgi:RNA polymerase sigma-70 factor (ECF subfamily)
LLLSVFSLFRFSDTLVLMQLDDEQLISDYIHGDEKALSILIEKYLSDAYNFAFRLIYDKQAAEDIAQESFIKAWKKIRGFRSGSSFKTWLFAIVRNTAIDWLRSKRKQALIPTSDEQIEGFAAEKLIDNELRPDELIARAENIQYVRTLLIELDPAYREVLTLRYSSNMTFAEIGNFLKRPLHTVKSQHRRALIALRRKISSTPI